MAAAEACAAVVRALYGTDLARTAKSPTDFATEADLAAEEAILAVLAAERPGDAVEGRRPGAPARPAAHAGGWSTRCAGR